MKGEERMHSLKKAGKLLRKNPFRLTKQDVLASKFYGWQLSASGITTLFFRAFWPYNVKEAMLVAASSETA
jgi:hypothetical protein